MMPSSIRLLLDDVSALATQRQQPSAYEADDTIRAIAQLGRALDLLDSTQSGSEPVLGDRPRLVAGELGTVIRVTAAAWPTGSGRLTDLAGAAADLTAITSAELGAACGLDADQRWAGQVALAGAIHSCAVAATRFPPYAAVPNLAAVRRLSDMACRLERVVPSAAWAWLDRDVAANGTPDRDAATTAPDAMARLLASARRGLADGTLHVNDLLAASAAAQAVLVDGWPSLAHAGPPALQAWRVLHAALTRFDDGTRRNSGPVSPVTEHASHLNSQVRLLNPRRDRHLELPTSLTATRHVVNQLPALADLAGLAVSRWTESGRLFARARALPRTDDRAADLINDRVVVVRPFDVTAVVFAARATARLSASVAIELDRSAGKIGHQPQPGLLAALRAQGRPEVNARDARWATGLASRIEARQQSPSLSALTR